MVDTITFSRPGTETFNPGTGLIESEADTVVYSGVGRLRMPTATETEVIFGDEQVTKLRFVIDVPHDVTGIALEDVATMAETDDASALGREFLVVAVPSETFNLYRSIGCEVVE